MELFRTTPLSGAVQPHSFVRFKQFFSKRCSLVAAWSLILTNRPQSDPKVRKFVVTDVHVLVFVKRQGWRLKTKATPTSVNPRFWRTAGSMLTIWVLYCRTRGVLLRRRPPRSPCFYLSECDRDRWSRLAPPNNVQHASQLRTSHQTSGVPRISTQFMSVL